MFIAKNDDLIVLAKDTREELEQGLTFMVYTSIEETDTEYQLYDGEYLTVDEITQKEQERIARLSLTKREVFLALYKAKGLTPEMIRSQITDPEALIEFDYATEYYRFNPLINQIGAMLGFSPEQIDYLFEYRELPVPDNLEGV